MSMDHSTLLCPNCQEPILPVLDQFKVIGCKACGSVAVLNKQAQLELTHRFQPVDERTKEIPGVGKLLENRKITYKIASVFVYHVEYKEWDEETSKWIQQYGFIKEWYAYNAEGQQLTIMQDTDKRYYLVSNPVPVKLNAPLDKKHAVEHGKYQLYGLSGMDNEVLEVKGYYHLQGRTRYECADENFEKGVVLQYQLTPLTLVQVKRMVILGEEDKLKAQDDFSTITFYRNVFGLALFFILGLLIFNLGMNESKVQTSPYISFAVTADSSGTFDTAALKPQLAGTFELKKDQNYRLSATCYLNETNQYVDYSLTIVRESDAAVVGDAALSFYTESGHDDEGYWEENLLQDKLKFQVDQSGKYQVFVAPDYENLWQFPSASLEIEIQPAPYVVFYLCMGSVFLLLFLIFQWQRENIIAFANLPHDTIIHDIYEAFQ